jgi:dTDP-4-dehydrorhamnose 3,5-epimerase
MMEWTLQESQVEGCLLITPPQFHDSRGEFSETYKRSLFLKLGLPEMVQDNHLVTKKGGVRAMHWQDGQHAQAKLVKVISGTIFDAVFDLRSDSPTYLKLATFELTDTSSMLFVPAGCAHGFQSLTSDSIVHYKTDREYDASSQRAFVWNDPTAGINWPITDAILSPKDAAAPPLLDVL